MQDILAVLMQADWAVLLAIASLFGSLVLALMNLCRHTDRRN